MYCQRRSLQEYIKNDLDKLPIVTRIVNVKRNIDCRVDYFNKKNAIKGLRKKADS